MSRHTKAGRRASFREAARLPLDWFAQMRRSGFARMIQRQCREQEADAPRALHEDGIALEVTCGACPVQIAGIVDGMHLYFRARGGEWRLGIAPTESAAVCGGVWEGGESCVYTAEGDDPDDGWMPHVEAWRIVREAIGAWRAGKGASE